jgi:hypothetical protein
MSAVESMEEIKINKLNEDVYGEGNGKGKEEGRERSRGWKKEEGRRP